MNKYECMIIVKPDVDVESICNNYVELIEYDGGEATYDMWGKKRLGWNHNGYEEGIYSLFQIEAKPDTIKNLDTVLKCNEDVIRYLILRKGY